MSRTPLRELVFGRNSAEDERIFDSQLLDTGFYDPGNVIENIVNGTKWLVLGPKGAGKSSISEHFSIKSQQRDDWFVRIVELIDFPFVDLAHLDIGGETRQARIPTVWTYLLCVQILASLEGDTLASSHHEKEYAQTWATLRRAGLLPSRTLKDAVLRLSSLDLKAKPPGIEAGIGLMSQSNSLPFYEVTETVRNLVTNFVTSGRHFVFIDGLDSLAIGEEDNLRWETLTALIVSAERLSKQLIAAGSNIRLVILCRTDLFYSLGYADANKIYSGSAVNLDWFPTSRRPEDTHLIDLAETKARVHAADVGDIIKDYLPREIKQGNRIDEVIPYLISNTRYLPRDFLQLMTSIARHSPPAGLPGIQDVIAGVKEYASEYFVEEIRTGLMPAIGARESKLAMDLVESLTGNAFRLARLRAWKERDRRYRSLELIPMLEQLYRIGAIANRYQAGNEMRLNFIFHNPRSRLNLDQEIVLHNALTRGLNIPWRMASF
ncbi:P-loop ATPase, Sll1717 family [Kribbella sp. NPDC002412]